jgi:chromatin assembly factor 1 subunit B
MLHGESSVSRSDKTDARSPDGQALILSSSDGYCSIVVFDLAELGTVHPTQQHHRQLAAIAQSHSHSHHTPSAVSTPVPHSPAVSTISARVQSPGPARFERESSTSSSITAHQSTAIPPLFMPHIPPPSSTTSSIDAVPPTPGEESEKDFGAIKVRTGRSESESSSSGVTGRGLPPPASVAGLTGAKAEEVKRPAEAEGETGEAPKKKRRVALTHLGEDA